MCSSPIPIVDISDYHYICHYSKVRIVIRPTARSWLFNAVIRKPSFCSITNVKKYFHVISFLCNPRNLFYTFQKITLRKGPDYSPDSQGLWGTEKVRETTSSFPCLVSACGFPGLLEVPLQGPVQHQTPQQACIIASRKLQGGGPVSSEGWLRVLGLHCSVASPHPLR